MDPNFSTLFAIGHFCPSSQKKSHVLKRSPNVMIEEVGGAFGRCLCHEGAAVMDGISALIRDPGEILPYLPCEDTGRRQPDTDSALALILGLLASRTEK